MEIKNRGKIISRLKTCHLMSVRMKCTNTPQCQFWGEMYREWRSLPSDQFWTQVNIQHSFGINTKQLISIFEQSKWALSESIMDVCQLICQVCEPLELAHAPHTIYGQQSGTAAAAAAAPMWRTYK